MLACMTNSCSLLQERRVQSVQLIRLACDAWTETEIEGECARVI